jgi:hypothetical protein
MGAAIPQGRKKVDGKGDVGVAAALDEGIEDLEEMMEELRVEKESGRRAMGGARELQRSRGRNFDRQASSLRRRLEKMPPADPDPLVKDIREIALPVPAPPPPAAEQSGDDERVHGANTSDVSPRGTDTQIAFAMVLCRCFSLGILPMTNVRCLLLCTLEGGNAEDEDGGDVKGHARADGGVQPATGSRRLRRQHWLGLPVKEMRQPAQPKGERRQPEKLERGQHREQRQRAVDPRRRLARPQPPELGGGEASAAAHGTIPRFKFAPSHCS